MVLKTKKYNKTIRVVSAGGVVVKRWRNDFKICLIRRGKKTWCLPKGHVERGERLPDTALREIREETGLSSRIVKKLGVIRYEFVQRKTLHDKRVYFFLCRNPRGKTSNHDNEVEEARWFTVRRALSRMAYDSEIEIVAKAWDLLHYGKL